MVGPATAAPGSLIEYAITYTNSRDDDDDDECEIDDFLDDDDLTYVSSSDGGSYDPATGAVTWTLGNVSGGLSKTVTVTARVSSTAQPGTLMISQAQFSGLLNSPLATTATMVLP